MPWALPCLSACSEPDFGSRRPRTPTRPGGSRRVLPATAVQECRV